MYAPVQNYNESRSESRSVINKISKNTDITAFYVTYKESTGFEPVHRFYTARWISSPVHYRSANSPCPQIIFSHFLLKMQGEFFYFLVKIQ